MLALPKSHEPNALVLLLLFLPAAEVLLFDQPGRRLLPLLFSLSFATWSFLLVTETEYLKVPSSFLMQPVFSAKFVAALVAWFCGLLLLAAVRRGPAAAGCPQTGNRGKSGTVTY